jgi:capsular exopolysaccharide synthesis family protein
VTNQMTNTQNTESAQGDALQVPVVPQIDLRLRPESRIFDQAENNVFGTEQYRLLLGRLLHLQTRMSLKRLLVTSAGRGEGKTHVSANLALTMAREADRRILLVDADFRKPDLHNVYGISNEFGLADVLRNGRDPWKAVRKVNGLNLYVLTAGSGNSEPPTASTILTLKMLLDQMNQAFDLVIIDSPPVLVAADTLLLAKLAEGVLFVVGASETPRDLVVKAKGLLEGNTIVGAVLNRASAVSDQYGYYRRAYPDQSKAAKSKPAAEDGKATQKLPGRVLS